MTSLLVSSRNAGNFKLFCFKFTANFRKKPECFCMASNSTKNSKSKVSTFNFTQDSNKKYGMAQMRRKCFTSSKHSHVCAELFTEDSFKQDLTVRSLLGLSFRPCRLALKRDLVLTICNFIVEHCKNYNKQALRKTSKLLSHFQSKISFVFRSKTFPANDSLTQKQQCSRQQ